MPYVPLRLSLLCFRATTQSKNSNGSDVYEIEEANTINDGGDPGTIDGDIQFWSSVENVARVLLIVFCTIGLISNPVVYLTLRRIATVERNANTSGTRHVRIGTMKAPCVSSQILNRHHYLLLNLSSISGADL